VVKTTGLLLKLFSFLTLAQIHFLFIFFPLVA